MQTYLKTKPALVQFFLFFGMAMGSLLISTYAGMFILSKITGLEKEVLLNSKNWNLSDPRFLTYIRGMILVQFLFLFTLPSLLFAYLSDRKPAQYLGLKAPSSSLYWVWGILIMALAFPFVEYLGYINQKIPVSESAQTWMKGLEEEATRQIQYMLKERTPVELLKNLFFVALFAGVGEELFFRGVLQRMLIRATRSPWAGIILAAALFSAFHFQFYGFLPRLFLGVLLGAIYWYSGSLWVAMLVHFLYDGFIITYLYFNPQALQNPEASLIQANGLALLASAMISLALVFVILHQMQKKSVTDFDAVYADDFPKPKDDFSF